MGIIIFADCNALRNMQKLNNKQQSYYVTATVSTRLNSEGNLSSQSHNNNKKIFISTKSIEQAFEAEKDLYNHKTLEIINVRHGKYRPKTKKGYIEIKSISDIIEQC